MQQLNEPRPEEADFGVREMDAESQAQAEAEAALEPEIDFLSQTLGRPIKAHGEEITILKWREPTALDIERAGNPIKVDFTSGQPQLTYDEKKMSSMMSRLCAIPPNSVSQMTASDWNAIALKLIRFFMPAMAR
jgi:Phage tail assembly chaperone proteins, E, or 41 or 14